MPDHPSPERPSDEYVRHVCRHLLGTVGVDANDDGADLIAIILVDHLLWAIGDEPHFNKALANELTQLVDSFDEIDRRAGRA